MNQLDQIRALAEAEAAESGVDLNEIVKGGGGGRLLPEGYAFGYLIEYIEFGKQPQEFGGKAKDPVLEFQLGFALFGQGYANDDGTPYVLRPYPIALYRNDKAKAPKIFKSMNWRGTAKNFAQMIGDLILVKIKHEPKSKSDPKIVSRIDMEGFLPPLDPVTKQPYQGVPQCPADLYKLFLWNRPTKAAWDSLYVEGTFDDGKSKNVVQTKCLSAVDFEGSPLQQLLLDSGVSALPTAAAAPQAAVTQAAVPQAAPAAVPPAAAPVAPAAVPPQVAAPLAQPAPVAVAPVVAQAGVPAPVTPAVPNPALPSSPALPA